MSHWFVYIMSNNSHTLYVGATNNLPKRIWEHKNKVRDTAFTARYTFDRCVYFESIGEQKAAIEREQQIKRWSRKKKIFLIERINPNWIDLSRRVSLDAVLS